MLLAHREIRDGDVVQVLWQHTVARASQVTGDRAAVTLTSPPGGDIGTTKEEYGHHYLGLGRDISS